MFAPVALRWKCDGPETSGKPPAELRPAIRDRVSPHGSEFDQSRENTYCGAPFSDALAARKRSIRPGRDRVPQGGLFNYGANAGCDGEAAAGVQGRQHNQRTEYGSAPARTDGRQQIQSRSGHYNAAIAT